MAWKHGRWTDDRYKLSVNANCARKYKNLSGNNYNKDEVGQHVASNYIFKDKPTDFKEQLHNEPGKLATRFFGTNKFLPLNKSNTRRCQEECKDDADTI